MFGLVIFLSHDILDILSKIPGLYELRPKNCKKSPFLRGCMMFGLVNFW